VNRPDHAAHYHILVLSVVGFISDPTLGWLQSEEVGSVALYIIMWRIDPLLGKDLETAVAM
jgi:hypothetical protein